MSETPQFDPDIIDQGEYLILDNPCRDDEDPNEVDFTEEGHRIVTFPICFSVATNLTQESDLEDRTEEYERIRELVLTELNEERKVYYKAANGDWLLERRRLNATILPVEEDKPGQMRVLIEHITAPLEAKDRIQGLGEGDTFFVRHQAHAGLDAIKEHLHARSGREQIGSAEEQLRIIESVIREQQLKVEAAVVYEPLPGGSRHAYHQATITATGHKPSLEDIMSGVSIFGKVFTPEDLT